MAIIEILDNRIAIAENAVKTAQDSKSNETKSSAGDKFETGRAMMQKEQEMNESFLNQAKTLKAQITQIDINLKNEQARLGSLVETTAGKYFIAIGMGKVKVNENPYFVISPQAPVAKLIIGKKSGDAFELNNKTFVINNIT